MSGRSSDWQHFEDEEKPRLKRDKQGFLRREGLKYEFDCPACDANNPWDDGFADGAEVRCHYCGEEFKALFLDEGRVKFKSI